MLSLQDQAQSNTILKFTEVVCYFINLQQEYTNLLVTNA